MALDWSNAEEVQKRREQAISAGYSAKEVDEFISKQRENLATENLVKSGRVDIGELAKSNPTLADRIVQQNPDIKALGSSEDKKKAKIKEEIMNNAQAMLDVLDAGRGGKMTGKQYKDALDYAASRFAASSGFSEGGKSLTGAELGILAGAMPKIQQPRKQNIIERITGEVPAATGKILDDEQTLRNKALLALGRQPEAVTQSGGQSYSSIGGEKSLGGLFENAGRDLGENLQGIASLPGAIAAILSGKVNLPDAGANVARGIFDEYKDIVTHPVETAYNKPISTALDIIPFLGAAGKLKNLGRAGKVAQAVEAVDNPAVQRILSKAGQVGKAGDEAGSLSKNIYQSVLNISKKGNAFEKLNPNETVGSMIKYGINGSPEDISNAAQKITGKSGILSNVVNNAITDVKAPAKMDSVFGVLNDSRQGRFSALSTEKVDELSRRLSKIPQGKNIGDVELSRLLDEERKLQSEAVNHRIAGAKGDTAAAELGKLKMEVADEIGNVIDEAVNKVGNISKYKDPAIIESIAQISPKLANDFANAKTIKDIRGLQKPFVRMSKILELNQNEPSSLGQRLFRSIGSVPVVGPILDAGAQNLAVPAATKTATKLNDLAPLLNPVGKHVNKNKLLYTILGREYNQANR